MTKAELKMAVEGHVCAFDGVAHRLRLQWVASEPRFSSGRKYLLAIDLLDDDSGTAKATVHVMTRTTVRRQQLLDLIEDAVVDEQTRRHTDGTVEEPSPAVVA